MNLPPEDNTLPPSQDPAAGGVMDPPRTFWGILRQLGPGLIIAGSIVGSGELIATTKTGAQAGMSLLWLIIIGCLIKVFVQIELGRYTITHGETTLTALNRVPCPRLGVNFIIWFWLAMMVAGIAQLGGIVGGVGQALALAVPIIGDYADAIQMPSAGEIERYLKRDPQLLTEWDLRLHLGREGQPSWANPNSEIDRSVDHDAWIGENVKTTRPLLTRTNAESLLDATRKLVAAEEQRPYEEGREQARLELRALLAEANQPLSQAAFQDVPEEDRPRLIRGQLLLGEQLADADQGDQRGSRAVAAVAEWQEAKAAEKERAKYDGGKVEISSPVRPYAERKAVSQAFVEHRKDIVNVLLEPQTLDDKYWAAAITLLTVALLYRGRYGMIQNLSLVLVVSFTFITVGNVLALQASETFHVSADQIWRGLSCGLPRALGEIDPLTTALATFGIIGVGASELMSYPYWCLEKGYAKSTGVRGNDAAWAERARGWMRVMHADAFLSMIIYTIATLAFFFVGVAVLHNEGRDPDGMRMVSTLATAYVPVFGEYARWLFLIGAIAVLYSTFLVANAGHARMLTDALKVFGLMAPHNEKSHDRSITIFGVVWPLLCLAVFCSGINPVRSILLAGMMQATLLPMIGLGALYLRYTRTDPRLKPSPLWDAFLILSCIGLLIAGLWGVINRFL